MFKTSTLAAGIFAAVAALGLAACEDNTPAGGAPEQTDQGLGGAGGTADQPAPPPATRQD